MRCSIRCESASAGVTVTMVVVIGAALAALPIAPGAVSASSTWPVSQVLPSVIASLGPCTADFAALGGLDLVQCNRELERVDGECRSILAAHLPERVDQRQAVDLRDLARRCRLARLRREPFRPARTR